MYRADNADKPENQNMILVDWVVVGSYASVEDSQALGYQMALTEGFLPRYRVIGLLEVGRELLEDNDD